jgi:hypothetical protein
MRTTINIDAPVLAEVKQTADREGKSLGAAVSELLAEALDRRARNPRAETPLHWTAQPMGERVDLADKDALYAALDEAEIPTREVAER